MRLALKGPPVMEMVTHCVRSCFTQQEEELSVLLTWESMMTPQNCGPNP